MGIDVQNWNPSIRGQLNNLPGFPARPNTTPPANDRWELGSWIDECHVRPEVANVAALPLVGNELGDVRVVLADQAWYIWDGAAWQSMGGGGGGAVNSVTASAPIASSGGANPNISLTGVVAAANGGTGLASPGTAGNILTSTGTGWTSSPAPATGVTDIPATAQEALNAGDLVRVVNDSGTPKVQKADATNTDNRLNGVGFALAAASANAAVTVRVAGVADVPVARFDAAPAVTNVGQRVFVSTTSGQITLTAPSTAGLIVQRAGILVDGSGNPKVLVQIGDPVLLS